MEQHRGGARRRVRGQPLPEMPHDGDGIAPATHAAATPAGEAWIMAGPRREAGLKPLFHFVMIKPSHYDDEGYPIQWFRSAIPCNTLACLNGLAEDARRRQVLGPDVEIRLHTYDETNRRVRPAGSSGRSKRGAAGR